jgi:hypothetical protein
VNNIACSLIICFGVASCAVPGQDPAATEDTAASAETAAPAPAPAPAKAENTVRGDQPANLGSGATTNANGNGQYCYTLCSNGVWYVNPRITVNCDSYGQTEVCPHRGVGWAGADWCNPSTQSCPSPAVIL